jgi:hypothetical protein
LGDRLRVGICSFEIPWKVQINGSKLKRAGPD